MTTKINGTTGITFPDTSVQATAADAGPTFFATTSGGSFAHDNWNLANFNVSVFNIGNQYNTSTKRFTPTVEGYYQFNVCAQLTSTATISVAGVMISKNNHQQEASTSVSSSTAVNVSTSLYVYMNGTTDYVECFVRTQGTGNGQLLVAGASQFSGYLARRAAP